MAGHQQTHFHKNYHGTDLKTEDILKNWSCSSSKVPRVAACLKACEISLGREMQYLALGFLHLLKQKRIQKGISGLQSKTNKQGWCYRCPWSSLLFFLCVQDKHSSAGTGEAVWTQHFVPTSVIPCGRRWTSCRKTSLLQVRMFLCSLQGPVLRKGKVSVQWPALQLLYSVFLRWGPRSPWPGWGFGVTLQTPCGDQADCVRNPPRLGRQLMRGKRLWSLTDLLFCSEAIGGCWWLSWFGVRGSDRRRFALQPWKCWEGTQTASCWALFLPCSLWAFKNWNCRDHRGRRNNFINVIGKFSVAKRSLGDCAVMLWTVLGSLSWAGY